MACLSFTSCHETKMSSWLPPVESWDSGGTRLPYGWEAAIDKEGKTYYINHVNKTTTYEDPHKDVDEEIPQPREVDLIRDPQLGFGFVAGSERPVIVRFVTEGGPNEHKLMPGDQILRVNGEDVIRAPREHVIELVRSCKHSVRLIVCQPLSNNSMRKSALLTAAKKAKLKNNPSRVRFAEGVIMNGSPLYSPSPMDSYIPFLPNVLKVFLENGQTKSFKYDSTTLVQDVLNSLHEKLSIKCPDHFSLVTEHVKIARRNRMAILDPRDTLAKIASRPGSHHLRCVYRVTFVPKDAYDLLQKDPIAFEYLYLQCCNDMVQERFAPELKYDIALRLAALHIQQHSLNSNMQGKITIKAIERECGLDRFVPLSLLETMKRKELRKLLGHFLKQNQSLCAPGQKQLTALQAKLHYLKIIGELPSYGAKCFSTNLQDSSPETALLVSPKFGLSQIACLRNTTPITLAHIEEISDLRVTKEDELSFCIEVFFKNPDKPNLTFSMEDKDGEELVLLLRGYYRLLVGKELLVHWDAIDPWNTESVPSFHCRHSVREAPWSYPPHPVGPGLRSLDLTIPPPPYTIQEVPRSPSKEKYGKPLTPSSPVDHNMNETEFLSAFSNGGDGMSAFVMSDMPRDVISTPYRARIDERHPGIDYQSVISMELLEDRSGDVDVDLFEARNDEVIKRISEMNQIVVDAETYLCDDQRFPYNVGVSDEQDTPEHHPIKAADSLLLLTQAQNEEEMILRQEKPVVVLDEEISPSESDTDSTPNDSPLHRSTPIRNSLNSHPRVRRDSSFGLHSPDVLPGLSPSTDNIMEILKSMQQEEMQLPFAEGTLYLDPDIIDLTMIPPPLTPDKDIQEVTSIVNAPPSDFVDTSVLQKELQKWITVSKSMIEGNPGSDNDASSADSARVVADLDNLCLALSEMKGANFAPGMESRDILKSFAMNGNIDSFIASVSVPPPPPTRNLSTFVPADDLSAFIIPPPPSSSPSTEAQNEVIARFMAAADDMKKMIGNGQKYDDDITPTAERGFAEIHRAWPVPNNFQGNPHFQQTLSLFDKFNVDSEFHSGDSSGYDTLTSSLTSYGEAALVEDVDNNTFNSGNEEMHMFDAFNSSSETTPVYEHAPTSLGNDPIQPHTRSSCLDATSPLSLTSPSSTTSSDSSVILADGNSSQNLELSAKLMQISLFNTMQNGGQTGSCDNLPTKQDRQVSSPYGPGISRSISWTSMSNIENLVTPRKANDDAHVMMPKPPIPPNPFQQSRLRKSFRRGPLKGPVLPRRESNEELTKSSTSVPNSPTVHSRSPSPSRKTFEKPLNGLKPFIVPLLHNDSDIPIQHKERPLLANGCVQNYIVPDEMQTSPMSSEQEFPPQVMNALSSDGIYISHCGGPFQQAQRDISTMVMHLKKLNQINLQPKTSLVDSGKFNATKEALVNESRQFVTSSKLFVKSAMELSDKMIENMAICVALLNRMFAVSELVIMHMCSREQVTFLIDKLRDVALAYLRTVDAAHKAIATDSSNPDMGQLMQQATTLATTLTSLMRMLRVISSN